MSPPSQRTDQCSPHGHCCPLAFIKTERGGKNNSEKTLCLEYWTLTIFRANARSMTSQPTYWCSPSGHCRSLVIRKTEQGGKKNGEKTLCLEYLTVLSLTFFQLNHFWGKHAINDIAAHRPMLASSPLPPACVYKNRAWRQKERWENIMPWQFYHSFAYLFSLKLLFVGLTRDPGIAAHRPTFAPSPLLPAWVH